MSLTCTNMFTGAHLGCWPVSQEDMWSRVRRAWGLIQGILLTLCLCLSFHTRKVRRISQEAWRTEIRQEGEKCFRGQTWAMKVGCNYDPIHTSITLMWELVLLQPAAVPFLSSQTREEKPRVRMCDTCPIPTPTLRGDRNGWHTQLRLSLTHKLSAWCLVVICQHKLPCCGCCGHPDSHAMLLVDLTLPPGPEPSSVCPCWMDSVGPICRLLFSFSHNRPFPKLLSR